MLQVEVSMRLKTHKQSFDQVYIAKKLLACQIKFRDQRKFHGITKFLELISLTTVLILSNYKDQIVFTMFCLL